MLDPEVIPENDDLMTGMEQKEQMGTPDIFWSREPITGPKGTKENPAVVPSFNDSRVVGLETEQVTMIIYGWSSLQPQQTLFALPSACG